jgi:hypothetical protein
VGTTSVCILEMYVRISVVYPDTVLNDIIHCIQVNVDLFLPVRVQFTNNNHSTILYSIVTCRLFSVKRDYNHVSAEILGLKPSLAVKRFLRYENGSCRLLETSSLLWNQQAYPWIRAFNRSIPRILIRYITDRSDKNES